MVLLQQQHKDAKQDEDSESDELSVSLSPLFFEFDLFELLLCAFFRRSTVFLAHALGSNSRSITCLYYKSCTVQTVSKNLMEEF